MTCSEICEEFHKDQKNAIAVSRMIAYDNAEWELELLAGISRIYLNLLVKALLRPDDAPALLQRAWKESMAAIGGYEV